MNEPPDTVPSSFELRPQMDALYRDRAEVDIPWISDRIPDALRVLADEGWVTPCSAVDLGCGVGYHTFWFAARGFEMTGVDLSEEAIRNARRHAAHRRIACRFLAADLCDATMPSDLPPFGFAYDWDLLHHIAAEQRASYFATVRRLLAPGGKYFTASFSIEDAQFGGRGSVRRTPIGTRLHFSTLEELRPLLERQFVVEHMEVVTVTGTRGDHRLVTARCHVS